MPNLVKKRDNTTEVFNFSKIESALRRAFELVNIEFPEKSLKHFKKKFERDTENTWAVEDIQDYIAKYLMKEFPEVAEGFITYRYKRKLVRDAQDDLTKEVAKKLKAENVVNQNANVEEASFGGRIGEAARVVTKDYALKHCMSRMSRKNHLNNEIYIHDLDSYAVGQHNCLTLPMDDLLKNGFQTRQADVRPANSLNTAFQLVAVIFQLQSLQQFGGVSAGHLDWTMVPYVKKSFYKRYKEGLKYIRKIEDNTDINEKLSIEDPIYLKDEEVYQYAFDLMKKELDQSVEGCYHNLNTLQSRSGNQLPFTSINYGTCTLPEGRLVTRSLLEGSIKGVGKYGKTSIFPCSIFQLGEGINKKPGDPNYDLFRLALESTSKRLYPNYANIDWSGNAGYDINDPRTYFGTMGCRTANGWDINGLGQLKDGRGNICPVTVIMPTLAMQAGRDVEKFMKLLDKKIGEAKDMLLERFEWICSQDSNSAKFMWGNGTMAGYIPEEGVRSALKHGTLALGQLGLADTLELLVGCNHATEKGMNLAKRIEELFKTRCAEYKEEYKLNFGVYYTPAENLCFTAMSKFKAKYGVIDKVSDKKYMVNSIHIPVTEEVTMFEKIDLESQLTGYSSAGCITYVECPSGTYHNLDGLEKLVVYAMDKDIPYFAINVPVDSCENCGYSGEIGDICPKCDSDNITHLRRVTGYINNDYRTSFNEGKQEEVEQRTKHTKLEK